MRFHLALALAFASSACLATDDTATLPPLDEPLRVLLLGDSISQGYTPFVQVELAERAHVVRPMHENGRSENCQGTNFGVEHLERWLAIEGGGFDVIHFNFGLHDLKRVDPETGQNSFDPNDPHQADLARYESQLRTIVKRLQTTGARLVFATTTPVPPGEHRPYRAPADAVNYNRVALRVVEAEQIAVDDLFRFIVEEQPGLMRPGDVHFSEEGSRMIAARVAGSILDVAGLEQTSAAR